MIFQGRPRFALRGFFTGKCSTWEETPSPKHFHWTLQLPTFPLTVYAFSLVSQGPLLPLGHLHEVGTSRLHRLESQPGFFLVGEKNNRGKIDRPPHYKWVGSWWVISLPHSLQHLLCCMYIYIFQQGIKQTLCKFVPQIGCYHTSKSPRLSFGC